MIHFPLFLNMFSRGNNVVRRHHQLLSRTVPLSTAWSACNLIARVYHARLSLRPLCLSNGSRRHTLPLLTAWFAHVQRSCPLCVTSCSRLTLCSLCVPNRLPRRMLLVRVLSLSTVWPTHAQPLASMDSNIDENHSVIAKIGKTDPVSSVH
jgi:hypothetical protein